MADKKRDPSGLAGLLYHSTKNGGVIEGLLPMLMILGVLIFLVAAGLHALGMPTWAALLTGTAVWVGFIETVPRLARRSLRKEQERGGE